MSWEQAFWRLFHIMRDWMSIQGPRDDVSGLRNYDKFYKSFREQIDQLVMVLPKKENENVR